MYVIGIGGFKRSGKDTFGRLLKEAAEQRGVNAQITAFADPVRKAAAATYGYGADTFPFISPHSKDVIDQQWGISPRQMMINLGEAMRASDPEHWIKVWRQFPFMSPKGDMIIVTDVRQFNEAAEVHAHGGTLALLQRPGVVWDGTSAEWLAHQCTQPRRSPLNAPPHGPFDVLVKNDGDVASLRRHADRIVRRVLDKATKKNRSK